MATNNWDINTDDYDLYGNQGSPEALPGTPYIDGNGHLIIPSDGWLNPQKGDNSTMDEDNTGPTTDFWTNYPITIDVNGYLFYYGENTGVNVRGPAGLTNIRWEDLTEEQRNSLKGEDGKNGLDGADGAPGIDGRNGLSAYQVWLQDNGWLDHPEEHPIDDFYDFIANKNNGLVVAGNGEGSIILNYIGEHGSANGQGATSLGYGTSAAANNSIAAGTGTSTANSNQVAIGRYNATNANDIFTVGNGSNSSNLSNALSLDINGNLTTAGSMTDGNNNILSNKVDKVSGKQLSTNDFTNEYKTWIDNFTVDQSILQGSSNPVSNNAVYLALEDMQQYNAKPIQRLSNLDQDYNFFHPANLYNADLETALFTSGLTWNPVKKILKTGGTVTHSNVFSFGEGLISSANNQFILGKYNEQNENDIFQIGYGTSNTVRRNYLHLDTSGNLRVLGTFIDGGGNALNNKQDKLTFDNTLVYASDNMVTSGTIYKYITDRGIDPVAGVQDSRVPNMLIDIGNLQTTVAQLVNAVAEIGNPRILQDDIRPMNYYTYGVNDGEFYIKLIEDETEDNNEEEEDDS